MTRYPPEMDPEEEPPRRTLEEAMAALREAMREMNAWSNRPEESPAAQRLAQDRAGFVARMEALGAGTHRPEPPAGHAGILAALAKRQADVSRALEMLAQLQTPPPPPETPPEQ